MPEISQNLISLFSYGLISGLGVIAVAVIWWALSRQFPKAPRPPAGLLIAIAFISVESIKPPSNFAARPGFLLFVIVLALWLTRSIFYWNRLTFLLLPLSLAGIFLIVPDTEDVALLLGILIPAVLFAWPLHHFRTSSRADASGLAAVVAWALSLDGQGRPASIVVSLGCLGLFMIVPFLQLFKKPLVFSMSQFFVMPILLHTLSISIAVGMARTTRQMDYATLASLVAVGVPTITILILSKKYYIEIDKNHTGNESYRHTNR